MFELIQRDAKDALNSNEITPMDTNWFLDKALFSKNDEPSPSK
jgi:hypothetical protein